MVYSNDSFSHHVLLEQAVAYRATKHECASSESTASVSGGKMELCEETKKLMGPDEETSLFVGNGESESLHELLPPSKLLPMNGGDGPYSYAHNSSYQRDLVEAARHLIATGIAEKLDINTNPCFDPSNPFRIADFGCSVGPNTFIAVDNIVKAIELKYMQASFSTRLHQHARNPNNLVPEFQVFFNDLVVNDFNILFKSLPPWPGCRKYFASGVPGTFRQRLFPRSSLHFAHSVNSLHWLSQIPDKVRDRNFGAAFNKAHIYCSGTVREVADAFANQFKTDLVGFMRARAEELVVGGLMVIHLCCLPKGVTHSGTSGGMVFDLFGSCLMDMANMGTLGMEEVENFNFPLYFPVADDVEEMIEEFTDQFSVEGMEKLTEPQMSAAGDVRMVAQHCRAAMEGILKQHFGISSSNIDIIEELFDRFTKKLADNASILDVGFRKGIDLFIILKRSTIM